MNRELKRPGELLNVGLGACERVPGSLRGTSTRRLNSATSTPSWFSTRVWTLTVPRSGFDCDGLTSSTSDSQNRVSPWNTGAGCLSSSVARFAIALPRHVGDAHAEREAVDERPDDDVAPLLGLLRVHVVDVQRVVVHRDQAEQVVVCLGHRLRGPVLVHGADLELLEVAPVRMGAARPRGSPDRCRLRSLHSGSWPGGCQSVGHLVRELRRLLLEERRDALTRVGGAAAQRHRERVGAVRRRAVGAPSIRHSILRASATETGAVLSAISRASA